LKQFFHATIGLGKLVGLHKKGVAIYEIVKEKEREQVAIDKAQLQEMLKEAEANLINIFYKKDDKVGPKEVFAGHVMKTVMVTTGKDKKGKLVQEQREDKVEVYPTLFCEAPKDLPESEDDGGEEE